jgi:hypothetical protein
MHLQAAWAHFVDEAVFAAPWLAGMFESSFLNGGCLRLGRRNKDSARSLPRNPVESGCDALRERNERVLKRALMRR